MRRLCGSPWVLRDLNAVTKIALNDLGTWRKPAEVPRHVRCALLLQKPSSRHTNISSYTGEGDLAWCQPMGKLGRARHDSASGSRVFPTHEHSVLRRMGLSCASSRMGAAEA